MSHMGDDMTLIRRVVAVWLVLAGFLAFGGTAHAYPDPTVTITLDPEACAGHDLPFWAASSQTGDWTVTYDGETRRGSGSRIEGTFSTRRADQGVGHVMTARLVTADDNELSASTRVVLAACGSTTPETPAGSGLPSAGSDLSPWWIVMAGGAIVVGAGLIARGRRRSHRRDFIF